MERHMPEIHCYRKKGLCQGPGCQQRDRLTRHRNGNLYCLRCYARLILPCHPGSLHPGACPGCRAVGVVLTGEELCIACSSPETRQGLQQTGGPQRPRPSPARWDERHPSDPGFELQASWHKEFYRFLADEPLVVG